MHINTRIKSNGMSKAKKKSGERHLRRILAHRCGHFDIGYGAIYMLDTVLLLLLLFRLSE